MTNKFHVFDCTSYKIDPANKVTGIPEKLRKAAGIEKARCDGVLWGVNVKAKPTMPTVENIVEYAGRFTSEHRAAILDIENWPCYSNSTDAQVLECIERFKIISVLFGMYATGPRGKIPTGYYGFPQRDYWAPVDTRYPEKVIAWQRANDRFKPLMPYVTAMFPSLYTFYIGQNADWVKYAKANVEEARRIGGDKPVYAFIWPEYHNSNQTIGGQFIEGDFWRLQLDTLRTCADGVVIWGGWNMQTNRQRDWDDTAEWWKVTKQFMKDLKK